MKGTEQGCPYGLPSVHKVLRSQSMEVVHNWEKSCTLAGRETDTHPEACMHHTDAESLLGTAHYADHGYICMCMLHFKGF